MTSAGAWTTRPYCMYSRTCHHIVTEHKHAIITATATTYVLARVRLSWFRVHRKVNFTYVAHLISHAPPNQCQRVYTPARDPWCLSSYALPVPLRAYMCTRAKSKATTSGLPSAHAWKEKRDPWVCAMFYCCQIRPDKVAHTLSLPASARPIRDSGTRAHINIIYSSHPRKSCDNAALSMRMDTYDLLYCNKLSAFLIARTSAVPFQVAWPLPAHERLVPRNEPACTQDPVII